MTKQTFAPQTGIALTSAELTEILLDPKAENGPKLWEKILWAEDTGFTIEESKKVSPWLLNFVLDNRDDDNAWLRPVVWSAIRTGSSMLLPEDTCRLIPLLDPNHKIETSKITMKMIGNIFEAHPPTKLGQHVELSNIAYHISDELLKPYVIVEVSSASMVHLAVYALAAMATSKILPIINLIKELDVAWFTRRMIRKLCYLRDKWVRAGAPPEICHFLNIWIEKLKDGNDPVKK